MPIRPENKDRYPRNWNEIVATVRERSGGRCECVGECGLHCTTPGPRRCVEMDRTNAKWANGRVILTVAHLDHQPENNHLSNLKHMCQRCHLRYDRKHHAGTRRRTFEQRTGQQSLLGTGVQQ